LQEYNNLLFILERLEYPIIFVAINSKYYKALDVKEIIGIEKPPPQLKRGGGFCGADRIRTGVQTLQPLAFYMLISLLIVGGKPEKNKPIHHLAGWS
jgi:hypothetical protein